MKLGCFGGSVTASEEFHLALKQRSRVILPFSSALLNLGGVFAGASSSAKANPLREPRLEQRYHCGSSPLAGKGPLSTS